MTRTSYWFNIGWILFIGCFIILSGCKSYKEQEIELQDSPNRGTIHISVDESFKPVIDEHVQVYESNHPGTKIIVDYKPEAECLKDMLVDSVRMVIATRYYTPNEKQLVSDSLGVGLYNMLIARDAIAVITHPDNEDSLFSKDDVKAILKGNFNKNLIPVFDGVKATSTVRFIIDSMLRGDSLTSKTVAARSSTEVIDYISRTKGAVGFIGVSWIGNRDDPEQLSFLKKVKVIPVESNYDPELFVQPSQASIAGGSYPMVRDLVYILKEKHDGLGKGFADFLSGEKGQLIFRRAYLMPGQKDFSIRKANLNKRR